MYFSFAQEGQQWKITKKFFFPCDTLIPQDIAMSNMDYRGFHKLGTNHSGRSFNCQDKSYLMQLPNELR